MGWAALALAAADISRPASRGMVTRFMGDAPRGFGREPVAHPRGAPFIRVRGEERAVASNNLRRLSPNGVPAHWIFQNTACRPMVGMVSSTVLGRLLWASQLTASRCSEMLSQST